jgi:hypothetical protein
MHGAPIVAQLAHGLDVTNIKDTFMKIHGPPILEVTIMKSNPKAYFRAGLI